MTGTLQKLYHLVPQDVWSKSKESGQPYYPPTYAEVSPVTCTAPEVDLAGPHLPPFTTPF